MADESTQPVVVGGDAFLEELLAWSRDSTSGLGLDSADAAALESRVRDYANAVKLAEQRGDAPPQRLDGEEPLEEFIEWAGDSIGGLGLAWDQVAGLEKRVRSYGDLVKLAVAQQARLVRAGAANGVNNSAMGQVDGEYCEFHGSTWPCEACTRLGDMSRCECIQLGFYGTILCRYHEGSAEGRRQVEAAMAVHIPEVLASDADVPAQTGTSDSGDGFGMLVDVPSFLEDK
jgi:hypothetical protein